MTYGYALKKPDKQSVAIIKPNLLIVEGPDDGRFFEAFLKNENIDSVQIHDVGGKDNLFKNLA